MSKHISGIKRYSAIALFPILVFAVSSALAQGTPPATGTPAPTEATPAVTPPATPPTKPIVINWKLKKLDGNVNVTMNPDGSSDFSGGFKDKKPGDDWDISIAVKSTTGAIIVYHWEGDAANGVQFSKTGTSAFLKDDFSSFASKHAWSGVYRFHLSAAGRRKHYEEMEAKRKKLKEEAAAAAKAKNEKLLKQKEAEEKTEAAAEAKWEENYEQQHPASPQNTPPAPSGGGGDGSSIGSTISSAVSTVTGVIGDIASFF
jgi:hypothetical protein